VDKGEEMAREMDQCMEQRIYLNIALMTTRVLSHISVRIYIMETMNGQFSSA